MPSVTHPDSDVIVPGRSDVNGSEVDVGKILFQNITPIKNVGLPASWGLRGKSALCTIYFTVACCGHLPRALRAI